jgi:hypothetical protein
MMKTSELTGAALDWAVAKALNLNEEDYVEIDNLYGPVWRGPEYSTDWALGGPIIEREELSGLKCYGSKEWECHNGEIFCEGPTPLIAAMRCFVAFKLGDEVEIPDQLIEV